MSLPNVIHVTYGSEAPSPRTITVPPVMTNSELQRHHQPHHTRRHFLLFAESIKSEEGYNLLHFRIRKDLHDFLLSDRGQQLCPSCIVHTRSRTSSSRGKEDRVSTHGLESISNEDFDTLMLSSIFCPVLPGDVPYRIKFTHAILAGCLPVVVDPWSLSLLCPSLPRQTQLLWGFNLHIFLGCTFKSGPSLEGRGSTRTR